eukprot:gnl/TRDRNA2_/TRDRNA2_80347_c2_seq1.p1 gnl/TRDRNA2_/TRDRNA2_80347_c2~~gnl/TRDRNA2_/TRDRNA2_80347_c2_seq1.p1  ORF type:complete len:381 (+),score=67.95 gnl/TRDRNA2_/TRDRNA2_80347_c2_seq1:161-1144(+)
MLRVVPGLRPTAAELLRHPWLKVGREPFPRHKLIKLYKSAVWNLKEAHFKKLLLRVLVKVLPKTDAHMGTARRAFRALDKNRDGLLSIQEFLAGLRSCPEVFEEIPNEDPDALFDAADRDNSAALDIDEFAALTMPRDTAVDERNLYKAFQIFDRGGNGFVTMNEIGETLMSLEGSLVSPVQITELSMVLDQELEAVKMPSEEYEPGCCRMKPRRIDFNEFVYLSRVSAEHWRHPALIQKQYFISLRFWGIDGYKRARHEKKLNVAPPWKCDNRSAIGAWSVYKEHGGRSAPPSESKKEKLKRRIAKHQEWEKSERAAVGCWWKLGF